MSIRDLTTKEVEFIIWALDYVTGVAQEMHDDDTGKRAWEITKKIRGFSRAEHADQGKSP